MRPTRIEVQSGAAEAPVADVIAASDAVMLFPRPRRLVVVW